MKELRFKTSKGEFVLVDIPEKLFLIGQYYVDTYGPEHFNLKEITEEQSGEIVFRLGHHSNDHLIPSAKDLLFGIIETKGIYLFENPYKHDLSFIGNVSEIDKLIANQKHLRRRKKAEEKTFKNPHIFVLKWKE